MIPLTRDTLETNHPRLLPEFAATLLNRGTPAERVIMLDHWVGADEALMDAGSLLAAKGMDGAAVNAALTSITRVGDHSYEVRTAVNVAVEDRTWAFDDRVVNLSLYEALKRAFHAARLADIVWLYLGSGARAVKRMTNSTWLELGYRPESRAHFS